MSNLSRLRLVRRGLTYYWRTHLAVVLGVATAVAVLSGALLVGDSVRGSLRGLVLQRIGQTDVAVVSPGFFGEDLGDRIERQRMFGQSFKAACPLVILDGYVTEQASGRSVHQVRVYGVDERFWRFHGIPVAPLSDDDALVGAALADRIGAKAGNTILVRIQRPSTIPLESLNGRKQDLGRTLRLTVRSIVSPSDLGEFSLEPQQSDVRAVFVPLSRLQRELDIIGRVNTLLVSVAPDGAGAARELVSPHKPTASPGSAASRESVAASEPMVSPATALESLIRNEARLEDIGLRVRPLEEQRAISIGSDAGLLSELQARAAEQALATAGLQAQPSFTYLANSMRLGDRAIPYSLVTAMDLQAIATPDGIAPASNAASDALAPIVLSEWAATDLRAHVGSSITLEYYVWEEPGSLVTRTTDFLVARIVPVTAGDRDLAPLLPGITDSPSLSSWDPPFPVDLRRVRPVDEAYWNQYGTTPKAFIPLEVGQRLWRSRYGALTSIRVRAGLGGRGPGERGTPPGPSVAELREQVTQRLRREMDPLSMGLGVRQVRSDGLAVSGGATDFGEYFIYFSVFLVGAALLLAALFFKLSVEQRVREVGVLRAVGFSLGDIRRLFMTEGLVLAIGGSALGTVGAIGYAALLMLALRTWWVAAMGTTAITLHVSAGSLVAGAVGGVFAAVACIWWTLRGLSRISERSLLAGQLERDHGGPARATSHSRRLVYSAAALTILAAGLLAASAAGQLDGAGAFFGAGSALLGAALCAFSIALRRPPRETVDGRGWQPLARLGLRNLTFRPGRNVVAVAVIASATFIIIAVDAFRITDRASPGDRQSGTGGYALLVESLMPIVHDPNTAAGRESMNLTSSDVAAASVRFEPFRVLPGDDASCLNLYEPRNPRIIAPTDAFLSEGRFAFQESLASTLAETANPWLLLAGGQTGVRQRSDPGADGARLGSDAVADSAIPAIADANSMTYVLHRKIGDELVIGHGGHQFTLRLVAALRDSLFQGELLISQANFQRLFPEQAGYRLLLVDAAPDRVEALVPKIENALDDAGGEVTSTAARLAEFHKVENTYLSTFQTLGGLGLLLGTVGLATVVLRNLLERRRELALLSAVGYRRKHFLLMTVAENTVLLVTGLGMGALCAALAIAPAVVARGGHVPFTSGGVLLLFAVFFAGLLSSVVATRAAGAGPLLAALRAD